MDIHKNRSWDMETKNTKIEVLEMLEMKRKLMTGKK